MLGLESVDVVFEAQTGLASLGLGDERSTYGVFVEHPGAVLGLDRVEVIRDQGSTERYLVSLRKFCGELWSGNIHATLALWSPPERPAEPLSLFHAARRRLGTMKVVDQFAWHHDSHRRSSGLVEGRSQTYDGAEFVRTGTLTIPVPSEWVPDLVALRDCALVPAAALRLLADADEALFLARRENLAMLPQDIDKVWVSQWVASMYTWWWRRRGLDG